MIRLIFTAAFSIVLIGVNFSPARGQTRTESPYSGGRNPPTTGPWNAEEQRVNSQIREAYNSVSNGPDGRSGEARGADNQWYSFNFARDLSGKQEKMLRPTAVERATYAQFLKQPHSGLVKLLPEKDKVVSVERLGEEGPTVYMFPGGGAYYSFTKLDHRADAWADLKLKNRNLEVAFGSDVLGAIAMLGDVPIESLTSDSLGVRVLARYARPSQRRQAIIEDKRFISGVTVDNFVLKTALPVHAQMTYALRSIAYGRSDLLVAVRVVKQNEDGSVLLLWKRLDKFSAPKLKAGARK